MDAATETVRNLRLGPEAAAALKVANAGQAMAVDVGLRAFSQLTGGVLDEIVIKASDRDSTLGERLSRLNSALKTVLESLHSE